MSIHLVPKVRNKRGGGKKTADCGFFVHKTLHNPSGNNTESSQKGEPQFSQLDIKLSLGPFKRSKPLHPSWRNLQGVSESNLWRTWRALTSGSGIWEKTEGKHWDSSTVPQPRSRSWGGHTGCSPTILSQHPVPSPPLPPSSSFSACVSACTGAVCRTRPQWPFRWLMVGAVPPLSSNPKLSASLSVAFSATTPQEPNPQNSPL